MMRWVLLCLGVIALMGCDNESQTSSLGAAPETPEAFLKWSMDHHAAMNSYSADVEWKAVYGNEPSATSSRTVVYEKPNKFRIVSENPSAKMIQTSVSNGEELVEFSNIKDFGAQEYPAPPSIAQVNSMQMTHPMFCGSLLYQFFGGSARYGDLIDGKHKVEFGGTEKAPDGEESKIVKFYSRQMYGNTEVLIGMKTGLVHRIAYDSDGLIQMMKEMPESEEMLKGQEIPKSTSTETYKNIKTNLDVPADTFALTVPEGTQLSSASAGPSYDPPVPIGSPAPDAEFTKMDGTKVKLSSLKGKVVLIDMWATWCPPCVKGLPITDKIYQEFKGKGLEVIAASDEDKGTVEAFLKEKKLSLPGYLDPDGAAKNAYGVTAIPTMVIIDAKGNLSSFTVGLEPEEELRKHLKAAGIG